jgi:hypothetical protein
MESGQLGMKNRFHHVGIVVKDISVAVDVFCCVGA